MVLKDIKTKLREDNLAWWTYAAGLFSLLALGGGIVYCVWAISKHEDDPTFLAGSLSPDTWQALWAFDLCMYTVGVISTIILVLGVIQVNQYWFLYWILINCVICAKHLIHLIMVLVFSQQTLPITITSAQFGLALIQVLFIFTVMAKYDQIKRIEDIIGEEIALAKETAEYHNKMAVMAMQQSNMFPCYK